MRARLIIIGCLFFMTGCKNKNRIPADIIPPHQMQEVLWDMMRADQFLADFVLNKSSVTDKKSESFRLYRQVFSIHHISREQFDKSFSFYKAHPALLKVIMDSLSQPKPEAPTEMIKQPILPDSMQQPPPATAKTDTVKPFLKKKLRPVQ
jgi:hypothetical protein